MSGFKVYQAWAETTTSSVVLPVEGSVEATVEGSIELRHDLLALTGTVEPVIGGIVELRNSTGILELSSPSPDTLTGSVEIG